MVERSRTARVNLPSLNLSIVRQYCSISEDDTSNDSLIWQYYKAALDAAESFCGRFFTESAVVITDYDDTLRIPSKVNEITSVKLNGEVTTDYILQSQYLSLPTVGNIEVEYTTVEDMPNPVWIFIYKFILYNLERNNPERGELDHSDLITYIER